MDITFNTVYAYDHVRQLLAVGDTFCSCQDTGPMNTAPIRVHKGIDNRLFFRTLGPDRTVFNVGCGEQVYARIIDPTNNTVAIEKLCRIGPAKGLITLELDSGDIADISRGLYNMVLIRTEDFVVGIPGYYVEKPLYSDTYDNVAMEVEITEQAFKAPTPSIVYTPKDWTPTILAPLSGAPRPGFFTGRIPGGRILNHKQSVHSFSTYTENFTGILELWGSLDEAPDPNVNDFRWFEIPPSGQSKEIVFTGYTGTQVWTFSENVMWIKFRYFPSIDVLDPGIMKKLIVRT